ncbi:hypothetical protein ACRAWD_26420 [Caulobacter segnis]
MTAVDADHFHGEIVPAARPVVFRGLVGHWPASAPPAPGDEACSTTSRASTARSLSAR